MPLYRANAIVLRRRSFEETDKLLVLYTREFGKLSAIAKGARRSQSRLVGVSEPLVYSRLQLAEGRNLDIISEATVKHTFVGLKTSPRKIEYALYLLELTDALVEERQPSADLFDLLLSSLYLLESRDHDSLIARRFELQALDIAGYTPEFDRCVLCRALRPPERGAVFSPTHGGILCSRCRSGQGEVLATAGAILEAGKTLTRLPAHKIDSVELSPEQAQELARVCRSHIHYHVGRDLKAGSVVASAEHSTSQIRPPTH